MGKIDCFGDSVVGGLLEGGLHLDMPFRGYFVGGNKRPLDFVRHAINITEVSTISQLLHELVGVEASIPGGFLKIGIYLHQTGTVQDIFGITEGKKGLNATGAAGNHTQGAGGRNGSA